MRIANKLHVSSSSLSLTKRIDGGEVLSQGFLNSFRSFLRPFPEALFTFNLPIDPNSNIYDHFFVGHLSFIIINYHLHFNLECLDLEH